MLNILASNNPIVVLQVRALFPSFALWGMGSGWVKCML